MRAQPVFVSVVGVLPALLIACHHEPAAKAPEGGGSVTAQIDQGKQLYVDKCAKCHGDAGQGSEKAPPVVGQNAFPEKPRSGAKRDVDFRTAADVFSWTSK